VGPIEHYNYSMWRLCGYTPAQAVAKQRAGLCNPLLERTAAEIAMERCKTRAKLLTGMRDTWRLAYAVARQERRAGLI
jgi:hypothetical protein